MKRSILFLYGYLLFLMITFVAFSLLANKNKEARLVSDQHIQIPLPERFSHLYIENIGGGNSTFDLEVTGGKTGIEMYKQYANVQHRVSNDTLYVISEEQNYGYVDIFLPAGLKSLTVKNVNLNFSLSELACDADFKINADNDGNYEYNNAVSMMLDTPALSSLQVYSKGCTLILNSTLTECATHFNIDLSNSRLELNNANGQFSGNLMINSDASSHVALPMGLLGRGQINIR